MNDAMNRRSAIKNVIVLGVGASYLLSCEGNASITLKNIPLTGPQEKLLAAMAEAILPTTEDMVGAKALESHRFVLMMTDECAASEDQQKFLKGMQQFEEGAKKKYNQAFPKLTPQQQEEFLLLVEAKTDFSEETIAFYQTVKRYTIQSFTTSEAYLTKRNFSLIPGKFKGCVPV